MLYFSSFRFVKNEWDKYLSTNAYSYTVTTTYEIVAITYIFSHNIANRFGSFSKTLNTDKDTP